MNTDYERRPLWQASMPTLPERRDTALPGAADVVVIGGGYTGLSAARELARRGAAVTLIEANAFGWGASTRNGGIVRAGYKLGPGELRRHYGEELGRALWRDAVAAYEQVKELIADEAIDCDFRECGHVALAYAPTHVARLEQEHDDLASVGVPSTLVERERLREEIGSDAYFGGLVVGGSGLLHPGKLLAGLFVAADRAGADLYDGVRATRVLRRDDGRFTVQTDRGPIVARDVLVATNGYTDGVAPELRRRIIPIASYVLATEPLPEDLVRELSPRGRGFFDTKNFLFYWHVSATRRMVFGGRTSFMPTSIDKSAATLHRGLLDVHPQLADYRVDHAWGGFVGFTLDKLPHVGRTTEGVTYAVGGCGSGIAMMTYLGRRVGGWMAGDPPPTVARLLFPLVPVPYEGHPWFMPIVGEWLRFQDTIAACTRRRDRLR